MKVRAFKNALEHFWKRAGMFFPTVAFKNDVVRRASRVHDLLNIQLRIDKPQHYSLLPPEVEMCPDAERAFRELCEYLQEHDSAGEYGQFCPSPSLVVP
jgi:hypothetical protein